MARVLLALPLLIATSLPLAAAQAQDLDLASLTCGQVGRIAPESVQTTVMGLSIGYAMGSEQAPFTLQEANAWFAAFRDLCSQAPKALVTEIMPLIADSVALERAE
ncbi:MAG: hypothetical protein AAFY02_10605 [Pseudomonadota bacterium]